MYETKTIKLVIHWGIVKLFGISLSGFSINIQYLFQYQLGVTLGISK